jgi:hypothetical protein
VARVVLVLGHLSVICEGCCAFPGGAPKATLIITRVIKLPHLWVGSYGVHELDEVRATPLSRRTTKCWST